MEEKDKKEILYKIINYEDITIEEAINLAKEIGLQTECDADSKQVKISLDLKNN
ncbi:MAG: hypothetical protein WC320_00295 [Candidatus Paceibacterota bacterium]|jgi:hypothetical protein